MRQEISRVFCESIILGCILHVQGEAQQMQGRASVHSKSTNTHTHFVSLYGMILELSYMM